MKPFLITGEAVMRRTFLLLVALLVSACSSSTAPTPESEGDWTPTLGGNTIYTTQTGRWSRVGDHMWVTGILNVQTLGTGSATQMCGLPVPSIDGQEPSGVVGYWQGINTNVTTLTITVRPASSCIAFHAATAASTSSPTISPLKDGSLIYFSAEYEAKH